MIAAIRARQIKTRRYHFEELTDGLEIEYSFTFKQYA